MKLRYEISAWNRCNQIEKVYFLNDVGFDVELKDC